MFLADASGTMPFPALVSALKLQPYGRSREDLFPFYYPQVYQEMLYISVSHHHSRHRLVDPEIHRLSLVWVSDITSRPTNQLRDSSFMYDLLLL
jgi:hypothetical protein